MKKIIIALFILIGMVFTLQSTVKINISLQNPGINDSYFKMDVVAEVLPGQSWRIGSSNIRVDWVTAPANSVSVKEDTAVIGAINCPYFRLTTTSISGGTAISLNVIKLGGAHCRLRQLSSCLPTGEL